jgi:hypothetical protein
MKTQFAVKLLLLNILCSAGVVQAAESTGANFEVSTGVEQDSNLNIVELDQSSQESDFAVLLGAKAEGKWQVNEKFALNGGYAFAGKTYQHQSAYDLALHQASVDASYNAELLTVGASYHYADANLDKKDFLALQQTSLYVAKLLNEKFYLRTALNHQNKEFAGRNERNARNIAWVSDGFMFFNQGKSFVSLGVSVEDENAKLGELDYRGNALKAKASHQYSLWGKSQKLQAGMRYLARDYAGVNSDIKRARNDSAKVSELEWEVGFTDHIAAVTKVEYGKYDSNLPSAKYAETRASITLKARF